MLGLAALVAVSFNASAGLLTSKPNETVKLSSCEGTLKVTLIEVGNSKQAKLSFKDVSFCSEVSVSNAVTGASTSFKLTREKTAQKYNKTVLLDKNFVSNRGLSELEIVIASQSRKHSDQIVVTFEPGKPEQPVIHATIGDVVRLPSCKGTLEIASSDNQTISGQVNLIFRDIESCSNFDIVSVDDQRVGYPNKKLQKRRDGSYGGSFTIPADLLGFGIYDIKVVVQSNSQAHKDQVVVSVFSFPFPLPRHY